MNNKPVNKQDRDLILENIDILLFPLYFMKPGEKISFIDRTPRNKKPSNTNTNTNT